MLSLTNTHPFLLGVVAKNRREERGVHKWHCFLIIGQNQQGNLKNVEMYFIHVFCIVCTCFSGSFVLLLVRSDQSTPVHSSPLLCTPVQCLAYHSLCLSQTSYFLRPGQTHPRLRSVHTMACRRQHRLKYTFGLLVSPLPLLLSFGACGY